MSTGPHSRMAGAAWTTPTGYAASHCRRCAMGWTRIGEGGGALTVCLLDREPVLAGMTSCDRFEVKEPAAATPGAVPASDRAA